MTLDVKNLCFAYKGQADLLKNISFRLADGDFLSIAGPNGAGKTTLLNLLCGILTPTAGSVTIDGGDLRTCSVKRLAKKVAVVRQEFIPVFEFTALQVVSMARTPYLGAFAFESQIDRQAVAEALEMTDTARFADRTLNHLSAGERQRVFIARALAQQTPFLLLDEPTTFLDMKHQVGIYDLLKKLQTEKQKTLVAVTHDINLAAQYSDTILLLAQANQGYDFGPVRQVLSTEKIESAFGVRTLAVEVEHRRFFFPLGESAQNPS